MNEEQIARHLSDSQWLDLMSAAGDAAARTHLAACADCANELARLRASFEEYRRAAQQAADRPESFWLRQRTSVVSRMMGRRAAPRLAWTATVAAILLAAILLTPQAPRVVDRPVTPSTPAQSPESDSALLLDVQRSVQREVPVALEPAALLVEEMNQYAEERRNP